MSVLNFPMRGSGFLRGSKSLGYMGNPRSEDIGKDVCVGRIRDLKVARFVVKQFVWKNAMVNQVVAIPGWERVLNSIATSGKERGRQQLSIDS
jgi:hypothetical protein